MSLSSSRSEQKRVKKENMVQTYECLDIPVIPTSMNVRAISCSLLWVWLPVLEAVGTWCSHVVWGQAAEKRSL